MKRHFALILGLFLFIGCTSQFDISKLRPGMSVGEMQDILGPYDEHRRLPQNSVEVYYYYKPSKEYGDGYYKFFFINGGLSGRVLFITEHPGSIHPIRPIEITID